MQRILHFVLMMAVLVTASTAQAYAMPCCQISAKAPAVAPPPVAQKIAKKSSMHCHGMSNMAEPAITLSLSKCPVPACSVHTDIAVLATEDAALIPLQHASHTFLVSKPVQQAVSVSVSTGQIHPPGLDRTTRVPLRV